MSKLVLNASRILVPDQEFEIFTTDYQSKEQLEQFRSELRNDFCIWRDRQNIVAVATSPTATSLDWNISKVRARDEHKTISSLVLEAFLKMAHLRGTPSRGFKPVTIPGGKNILADLPNGSKLPEWLQVRTKFKVETRILRSSNRNFAPFLVLDSRSTREILAPVSTLIGAGFNPVGKYVQVPSPSDDPRLAPRLDLVGRVDRVDDGVLHLVDLRGDVSQVEAREAFLEPRDEFFEELIGLSLGKNAPSLLNALESSLATGRQAEAKLTRLRKLLSGLTPVGKPMVIAPNIAIMFDDFLRQGNEFFPVPDIAPSTKYVFDVGRSKVDEMNRRGIESYGPYNCNNFTPTEPRIAVICEAKVKGVVESFLRKLKDGISLPNVRFNPYGNGFASMFRLRNVTFQIFETINATPVELKKACQEIAERGQSGNGFDLVLLQNSEEGKKLKGNQNPYLVAKSMLLQAGIASQSFLIEKTRSSDYDLSYIIADLALGCYAKLGGTPWLISADHAIEHEIILGVGSASLGTGRFGDRERIVGITSVFKGDGDYLLSNLTKAVPFNGYLDALISALKLCIDQVSKDMNWKSGDGVRIVVHAFKPMKNSEIDAVEKVVQSLNDYRVQFAFLHVNESHPFSLFDETELGTLDKKSGIHKGKLCPRKGTFVRVSRNQTLVCPWGAREVKHAEHGYPKPLLLDLHERSTFTDQTYLARQVLNFSSHSWRSFGSARTPVTILYSDLVADMLGKLKDVDGWSADILPTILGKRRWFL